MKKILTLFEPAVNGCLGIEGVEGTLSFSLPKARDKFEISGFMTGCLTLSLLNIVDGIKSLTSKNKQKIFQVSHAIYAPHISCYKHADLSMLGLLAVSGNKAAANLIQNVIPLIPKQTKVRLFNSAMAWISKKNTVNRVSNEHVECKESKIPAGIIQALCSTLVGYLALDYKSLKESDLK